MVEVGLMCSSVKKGTESERCRRTRVRPDDGQRLAAQTVRRQPEADRSSERGIIDLNCVLRTSRSWEALRTIIMRYVSAKMLLLLRFKFHHLG